MAIHVGDVGVDIQLEVSEDGSPVDLTAATQLELRLRDPDGTTLTRPALLVAPSTLRYLSAAGDFTKAGSWEIRGQFTLSGWHGATTALYLTVSRV